MRLFNYGGFPANAVLRSATAADLLLTSSRFLSMNPQQHYLAGIVGLVSLSLCNAAFAADKPTKPVGLKFRVQQLHLDNNEGCAVADYNKDGKLDVSAGEFWYPGPDFKEKKPVRTLQVQKPDYVTSNAEHAWDVNDDGWPDIISGSFLDMEVSWYENPKGDGLTKGDRGKKRVLVDTKLSQNEWTEFRDMDGDGVPEFIVNSWNDNNPMVCYALAKDDAGEPFLDRGSFTKRAS